MRVAGQLICWQKPWKEAGVQHQDESSGGILRLGLRVGASAALMPAGPPGQPPSDGGSWTGLGGGPASPTTLDHVMLPLPISSSQNILPPCPHQLPGGFSICVLLLQVSIKRVPTQKHSLEKWV